MRTQGVICAEGDDTSQNSGHYDSGGVDKGLASLRLLVNRGKLRFCLDNGLVCSRFLQHAGITHAEAIGEILLLNESMQRNGAEGEEKETTDREVQNPTRFCRGRGRCWE